MQLKKWLLVVVLLVGCVSGAWAQPQAGYEIFGFPNGSPQVAAVNGSSFNICKGTTLGFTNTASADSVCYKITNSTYYNSYDTCDNSFYVKSPIYISFNSIGNATVTQIATRKGKISTVSVTFIVSGIYPTPDFTIPAVQCGSNIFNFLNTSTAGTGATITSYLWAFKGSSTTSSSAKDPSIVFDQAIGDGNANYNVTLTVTNSFGCTNFIPKSVPVTLIPDVTINSDNASQTIYENQKVFSFCNGLLTDTFDFNNASSTIPTNTFYNIKWGNPNNDIFQNANWNTTSKIVYGQGFDTMTVSITGKDGCVNTKQFGVYVGQQPGSGLNSPPGKTVFCIGTTIPFAFTQLDSSNSAGTSYRITIRENPVFDTIIYQKDILKNWPYYFVHTFNQSSCGVNDPRGSDPNAFAVSIWARNPCDSVLNGPGSIHISEKPIVKIAGPTVMCNKDTATFTNKSTWFGVYPYCSTINPPDVQQVWKIIPPVGGSYKIIGNSGSISPYASGDKSINVVFNGSGTYDVRLYVKANNTGAADCVTGDSTNYTDTYVCVRNTPFAKFTLDKKSACAPYTFTATQLPDTTISCAGDSVAWRVDTVANCTGQSGNVIVDTGNSSAKAKITFPQPGKYAITLMVASKGGGCTSYFYDTVNVYDKVHISNWQDSLGSLCLGDSIRPLSSQVSIDSCFSNGAIAYKWIFMAGKPDTTFGLTPPYITYNSQGSLGRDSIKFSATNGCGTVSDTAFITVKSLLTIAHINDTTICTGNALNITPTSPDGITSYFWTSKPIPTSSVTGNSNVNTQPGGTSINDVLVNVTSGPPVAAKVQYTISAADGACKSNTDVVTVTVLPTDTANAGPDQFLCKGTDSCYLNATPPKFSQAIGTWSQGSTNAHFANVNDPNTKVTGLAPNNTYTFVWTITGSGSPCVDSTDTVNIVVDTIVNFIDPPLSICAGDSVTIKGHMPAGPDSTSYSYEWLQSTNGSIGSFVAISNSNSRDIRVKPNPYKYFRRIVTFHNCVDTSNTIVININNTKPVASFTPTDTSGCGPINISFTNTTTPAPQNQFTYQWFVDATPISQSSTSVVYTFNTTVGGFGDTLYHVTLNATNGCYSSNYHALITVRGRPKASFTPDTSSGCSPFTNTFTNNSVGSNVSYTWNFGDNKGNQNISAVTFPYTFNVHAHTDFKVKLLATNDCGSSADSTIISVNANTIGLHVGISAPLNFGCTGDSVFFSNNTTGANLFTWNFGDNAGNNNTLTTTDSFSTVSHVYKSPGVYTVQLCAANSCTKDTCTSMVVFVKQTPKAIFTVSPDTVCVGDLVSPINLSQPLDSALVYQWRFGDGTPSSPFKNPTHKYTVSGLDTIRLTVSAVYSQGFACYDSIYQPITINGPTGVFTYNDSACAGGTITFQVSSTNTATYLFNFGDNTPPVQSLTPVITHTYSHPGVYLPQVTLTTGNCSLLLNGTDSIRVDSIHAAFKIDSLPVCDTTNLTFTDSSYAYFGVSKYSWAINGTGPYTGNLVKYALAQTTNPFIVSLKVTGKTGCTSQIQSQFNVYVHQTPAGTIAVDADTCARDSVHFSANFYSNDPVQYFWDFSNGDRQTGQTVGTIFNPPGVYTAQLMARSSFGCADTLTRLVTIKTTPNLTVTPVDTVRLCKGDTLQLNANGNNIVTWGWGPVDGLSCIGCSNPLAYPSKTTLYTVTGTNSAGCTSKDSITVNVIQPINVEAKPLVTSICLPADTLQPIQFFASGAYTYRWSPANWLDDSTAFNPVVTIPPGALQTSTQVTYTVTGYDQYHCSSKTASVVLYIGLQPTVDFGVGDTGVAGRTDTLFPKSTTNGPFISYNWRVSGPGFVTTLTSLGDKVQLTINGDITVYVTATNNYGCSVTDTLHYSSYCNQGEQVYIPNAFSPDGDGINDVFMVQGRGIVVQSFKVFNRWGQVVYDGGSNFAPNVPAKGWDGTVNGHTVTDDVYVYIAKVLCTASNISFFQKGNVTLIRVKK